MRLSWRVLASVLLWVLVAGSSTAGSGVRGSSPESAAKALAPVLDEEAARMLQAVVKRPGEVQARELLAAHYRDASQGVVASFYSLTVDYLQGRELAPPEPRPLTDPLGCEITGSSPQEVQSIGRRVMDSAREVSDALSSGSLIGREGLDAATRAIERTGASCPLLGQWSVAYLWYQAAHPQEADPALREAAIRSLITLGDNGVLVAGYQCSTDVYQLLANIFSLSGDQVSAYIAALISEQRVPMEHCGDTLPNKYWLDELHKLRTKLEKLAATQRGAH